MSDDILINVFDEDLDSAEVDRLTLALRRELLEIAEVEDIAAVKLEDRRRRGRGRSG